jgi:hypothetical protein
VVYVVQDPQRDVIDRHSEWIQTLTQNKHGELSVNEFLFRNLEIPPVNYLVKPVIRALALHERMTLLFYEPDHLPPLLAYFRLTLGDYLAGDCLEQTPYGFDYEWRLRLTDGQGRAEIIPFKLAFVMSSFIAPELAGDEWY